MSDTIRLQPFGRDWQTLGAGLLPGVEPDGITATFDAHGPATLGFDLKGVDQRIPALELAEFTPVDLLGDDGAEPAWGGFLIETPGRADGLGVQALGWQHHLDDDTNPALYAYSGLNDFVDVRTVGANPQSAVYAGESLGQVTIGAERIRLGWPSVADSTVSGAQGMGAVIDLGDGNGATKIAFTASTSFNAAFSMFYVIATNSPDWRDNVDRLDYITALPINGAAFVAANVRRLFVRSIAAPRRYITFLLYLGYSGLSNMTEHYIDLHTFTAFRDTSYGIADNGAGTGSASGDAVDPAVSLLKADTVIRDQFGKCPLLSRDYSRIEAGTHNITGLGGPGQDGTPRDLITRADSYHRRRWGVDALRRGYWQSQPATPALVVNTRDDGVEFTDASVNSGRDVYNKAVVLGRSGSGRNLRVERLALPSKIAGEIPLGNPSATVDLTGWTYTVLAGAGGGLTRDTAGPGLPANPSVHSAPAAFKLATPSTASSGSPYKGRARLAVAGALPGGRYRLTFYAISSYPILERFWPRRGLVVRVTGSPSGRSYERLVGDVNTIDSGHSTYSLEYLDFFHPPWTSDTSFTVDLEWTWDILLGSLWFDTLKLESVITTAPDRRGFTRSTRLDVQAATDPASMELLGDLFLAGHARPPFKGSLTVTGDVVTDRLTGKRLTPLEVASRAGELIELADVIDPISGDTGRVAAIASSNYSRGVANLALDQDRGSFEALQARMNG
jgi:hypothetical protein